MNRFRAGFFGDFENFVGAQIAFIRRRVADVKRFVSYPNVKRVFVDFGINGDGFDFHFAAGADDSNGDFAAIGDQNFVEHI